mgnify:CR=1 FL=1
MIYQILHSETPVAQIDTQGSCHILSKKFMPFNLYLEETNSDNLSNFYFWCANRTLPSKRQHKDVILKSLNITSKESAQIALQCHCLSLTNVYWVRNSNESITFQEINLYDDHSENPLIDASLLGKQITLQSLKGIEKDLSTDGCFPKAWLGNTLLKGGNPTAVRNEILASKICQCFQCSQVLYKEGCYKGELVSISNIFTSKEYSIASKEAFDIYAVNHDIDPIEYILSLDAYSYYVMNILDYLTGNTDRHWGNWGFLIDNQTNIPISLHPLMDFNQSFTAYDSIEGANCLTTPIPMIQKEAAIEAVKQVGLNQINPINPNWFQHDQQKYEMFLKRLSIMKEVIQK